MRGAMLPFLADAFGNANSIHSWGLRAHDAVEQARAQVAALIGAEDPSQIYFTSGATESNNWVLNAADAIFISPFEHSAMLEPALARGGKTLDSQGIALSERNQAGERAPLLSWMAVNNEMGAIWDVRSFAQLAASGRIPPLLHSDITQAAGKLSCSVDGLDFASFSAHKFYGPKGIGALYCKGDPPPPLILGGEQEHGYRGGTLNVAAIVGMGKAAEIASDEQAQDYSKATELREIVLDELRDVQDWRVNPPLLDAVPLATSPFILSLSFVGLQGESLVLEADRAGYGISAGAACSSRSTEPSHVLTALNLQPEWLRGTIRVSFGRFNSKEAAAGLAKSLESIVKMFRTL